MATSNGSEVMEFASCFLAVVHGGVWNDNVYDGGRKELIPIPLSGIRFDELVSKLEVRLKKCRDAYSFDIDSVVELSPGERSRMKITTDFELSCLLRMHKSPTVYVDVSKMGPVVPISSVNSTNLFNHSDVGIDSCASFIAGGSTSAQTMLQCGEMVRSSEECIVGENDFCCDDQTNADLGRGSTFPSKDNMVSAVGLYHLKKFAEYHTKRSDTGRYYLVCKFGDDCTFKLRARARGLSWRIRVWSPHSCVLDLRKDSAPKVSAKVLAAHVGPNLAESGYDFRPRDIQGQILRDFGVQVKYSTALAGKNSALRIAYGDPAKSFQLLPNYLYMLQHSNPGSIVDLQIREDGSFEYCYFCLAACMRAFRSCRPIIVVDATHLKGVYKGVLFVATTKDANEQIVPLAFGVGDKETDSAWGWFLQHVRESFGVPNDMLIVSDQHQCIKNAVASVFPGVAHGFCTYHVQGNLRRHSEDVIEIFQVAAKANRDEDFNLQMKRLETSFPVAYAKLLDIDPIRWAKCKCPVRRYGFGTSNAVECMNSRLKWARKLPICRLLEYVRNLVQKWFFERRTRAGSRTTEISEYAMKRLDNAIRVGRHMRVEPISASKFNVISRVNSHIVDISARSCSCEVFQRDLFPCSHAARAIRSVNQSPFAYVNQYYSTATWLEIYAADVMPLPDPSIWCVPAEVASIVIGTPVNPRQAGRPRVSRVEVGDRVCSRCHQTGHFVHKCKTLLQMNVGEEVLVPQQGVKRRRQAKKCGICGVVGHTRRKCNQAIRIEQ